LSSDTYGCIVLTVREWFEKCLEKNCTIFSFPPTIKDSSIKRVMKLSPGSICLVLVKNARREDREFVGEFTVKNVAVVKGEEFSKYAPRAVETPKAPFPKPGERTVIIEFEKLVKYGRPVKLRECEKIMVRTKPLSDEVITGFTLLKPDTAPYVIKAVRDMSVIISPPPSHDELVKELMELGEWLGFVVEKEGYTPDKVFRLDVLWRRLPDNPPLKAFEVELGGEVVKALTRLKHAYDRWNCQQLWLIVSDEAKAERAWKLVEPRLKGAFEEIRGRVIVVGWKEVHELYTGINPYKDVLKELLKR
jgi:predicted RNA-binding protein/predicted transcriptional regulator